MASSQIANNFVNTTADEVQTIYTAPQASAVAIDAITAANNSLVNASYSLYIKTATGVLQPLVKSRVVVWGENDLAIGAVNQVIPAGAALKVESSAINSIYFTVTGREI